MPLPLHRVRFSWGADRHIEIECVKGRGISISTDDLGPFSFAEREENLDEFAMRGVPAICWREDGASLFEPFQLRENTEYFVDITLPLARADAEMRAKQGTAWPFSDRLANTFRPDPPRRSASRWTESDLVTSSIGAPETRRRTR